MAWGARLKGQHRRSGLSGRAAGYLRALGTAGIAAPLLVCLLGLPGHGAPAPHAWVGATRSAQAADAAQRRRHIRGAGALRPTELKFDPNSAVDMTEKKLLGTTLKLTSSIFGFPDFPSLVDLQEDGSVRFYAGMVSKEPGSWCVVEGNKDDGERPDDLYLEFTQPLTEKYVSSFTVPGGTCFWRGKLDFQGKEPRLKVAVEGGVVVSERDDGRNLVREGVFRAISVDAEAAGEVSKSNKEAFDRALLTPKGESTGFKTPARIAGAGIRRPRRQLKGASDDDEIEDD
mmetsp:Transcript_110322/g.329890  ORF Transcript_110322/g.329890 Transcript_110322/m.329890 type:complete len:287 (-) Transcript_110322:101-961(-)